ncbi:hypothetical protein NDU88_002012 [Pleurodeles waltl]|uniref:Uncharacterized protein n=1 Tax=Pleurodeles waltl TaxID=8319 RepID=A0AAV7V9B8_PLEWA|nr:hypothetical protein NDU88_002012 [Pleurodeles waltl]
MYLRRVPEWRILEAAAAILGPGHRCWGEVVLGLGSGRAPAWVLADAESALLRKTGALEEVEVPGLPGRCRWRAPRCRGYPLEVLVAIARLVGAEPVSESAMEEVGVPCCGYSGADVAVGLCWQLEAGPGGSLSAMGKHDAKQPKLNFDHKRSTRQVELEQGPQAAEGRDLAADDHGEDLRTLMLEMRSSLRNIDTKLDNLTSQLDSVKTQVATHETRSKLLGFERQGSPADLLATPFHTGK